MNIENASQSQKIHKRSAHIFILSPRPRNELLVESSSLDFLVRHQDVITYRMDHLLANLG